MKIHEHLNCRAAAVGEAIPKLCPSDMSFWRKDGDVYREYPIKLAPINMDLPSIEVSDLKEGDFISFPQVVFPAKDVLEQMAAKGFLKIQALGKYLATARL